MHGLGASKLFNHPSGLHLNNVLLQFEHGRGAAFTVLYTTHTSINTHTCTLMHTYTHTYTYTGRGHIRISIM